MGISSAELAGLLGNMTPAARASVTRQLHQSTAPVPMRGGVAVMRAARQPGQMTKTERLYADRLELQKTAGLIRSWKYERVNLKLDSPAEGRAMTYRPDFLVWHADGHVSYDEIKGGWVLPAGVIKFRAIAEIYPEFWFRLWQYKASVWTLVRESEKP